MEYVQLLWPLWPQITANKGASVTEDEALSDLAEKYFHFINGPLSGLNLTAMTTYADIYTKQVLDSVAPYLQIDQFKNDIQSCGKVLDVGFGGGFPLLPLAKVAGSAVRLVGIDGRAKKVTAVCRIARELELEHVKVFHERLENILFDTETIVVIKAVGKISELIQKMNCPYRTKVYFYKGPQFNDLEGNELETLPEGWSVFLKEKYQVEGTEGRMLIGLLKEVVPRGTKTKNVKKTLVSVSDFFNNLTK